jgi:hypothetical protein
MKQLSVMKRTACAIGLATFSIGLSVGLAGRAAANARSCFGASCIDQHPIEYGCDRDAVVEDERTVTVNRWQDGGQAQEIVIQKMYSASCNANWSRAYIPNDTYLFIKEQTPANQTQPVRGMFRARGTGYFWAESHMANGAAINQACVALPILSSGSGHDLFDRHCTDLN